jgi:hypothetical protein
MTTNEKLLQRLDNLLSRIDTLLESPLSILPSNPERFAEAEGILLAAGSLAKKIFSGKQNDYSGAFASSLYESSSTTENKRTLLKLRNALVDIKTEADMGILSSIVFQAQAIVFDDFLNHAKAYLRDGRKNEAGVIVGVTTEDVIRRLAKKHAVAESRAIEQLVIGLKKSEVISEIEESRLRVCVRLRNKAAHCNWDEFTEDDVRVALEFLIGNVIPKLGA